GSGTGPVLEEWLDWRELVPGPERLLPLPAVCWRPHSPLQDRRVLSSPMQAAFARLLRVAAARPCPRLRLGRPTGTAAPHARRSHLADGDPPRAHSHAVSR